MKTCRLFSLFFITLLSTNCFANGLKISGYVATSPKMSQIFAAYLTIENNQNEKVKLLKANSDDFEKTELHLSKMDNGMMKMVEQDYFLVNPHSTFAMKPGSYHIMLIKNKKPIIEGETVSVKLYFDDNTDYQVLLPVKPRTHSMHLMH